LNPKVELEKRPTEEARRRKFQLLRRQQKQNKAFVIPVRSPLRQLSDRSTVPPQSIRQARKYRARNFERETESQHREWATSARTRGFRGTHHHPQLPPGGEKGWPQPAAVFSC